MSESPLRVVVAEDSSLVAMVIEEELRLAGVCVVGSARNGREAVTLTCELSPDAVLMDIMMPVMGGVEATREIQRLHPTPVVFVTCCGEDVASLYAREAGAQGYLIKPVAATEMLTAIQSARARFADARTQTEGDDERSSGS